MADGMACVACRFFFADPPVGAVGQCRFNPPSVREIRHTRWNDSVDIETDTMFPIVSVAAWCGKFEAKHGVAWCGKFEVKHG